MKADGAEVFWDVQKKAWVIRIKVGEEAVRRTCKNSKNDLGDKELRDLAVQTATDEGYELPPDHVVVKR